jgi:hypothetical protein
MAPSEAAKLASTGANARPNAQSNAMMNRITRLRIGAKACLSMKAEIGASYLLFTIP